jgi:hypothetical protein
MSTCQYEIEKGVFYVHNPKHRNFTPDAGRWTISEEAERLSFGTALRSGWVGENEGWGLHIENDVPTYLGVDRFDVHSFVAKYIDSSGSTIWHGFPKAPADVPGPGVLKDWLQEGTLRKKTVKLLSQGRPCSL